MADNEQGYYGKYDVTRRDGSPVGRTFVIEIDKDPQAEDLLMAIAAVYKSTRPILSRDLQTIATFKHLEG